jgi:pyruvate/2-oxoglutarate dehydrogenase complex dihydrolipoamide acyltransferase (E2) component
MDQPRVATTVTVQLSADRRVVDEATAAEFLQVCGESVVTITDMLRRPTLI